MTVYIYSKSEQEATAFQLGWRRAFSKLSGGIFLFPSEATSFICQWQPYFKFSCKIPAQKRQLRLNYYKTDRYDSVEEIQLPELILTQLIKASQLHRSPCGCEVCLVSHTGRCFCYKCCIRPASARRGELRAEFFLHIEDENYIQPYLIANIYDDGRICWGNQPKPLSLRQANTNFWSSEFNNDFGRLKIRHTRCSKAIHRSSYCFLSNKSNHLRECYKEQKHRCGCEEGNHIYKCVCAEGLCICPCVCKCCSRKCSCICRCNCCRKTCGCGCRCNLNKEFAAALSSYCQPQFRPSAPTCSVDHFLCGRKFISSTAKIQGVFISYEPKFLSYFPKQLQETDPYGKSMIIGFARIKRDGDWEVITRNGESITVLEREVQLV